MNFSPIRTSRAFTLIELLTVIAIIAILMGLLFPAVGIVKEQANKASAKNDVSHIVTAIRTYNVDYGKYPNINPAGGAQQGPPQDAICGDPAAGADSGTPNSLLFNTLRAIPEGVNGQPPHSRNPKRVVFFEGRSVTNMQQPRKGFVDQQGADSSMKGSFFDPWGKQYTVIMDQNSNNVIGLQNQYTDFTDAAQDDTDDIGVRIGVGAFSLGRDNTLGTKGNKRFKTGNETADDVLSWQ